MTSATLPNLLSCPAPAIARGETAPAAAGDTGTAALAAEFAGLFLALLPGSAPTVPIPAASTGAKGSVVGEKEPEGKQEEKAEDDKSAEESAPSVAAMVVAAVPVATAPAAPLPVIESTTQEGPSEEAAPVVEAAASAKPADARAVTEQAPLPQAQAVEELPSAARTETPQPVQPVPQAFVLDASGGPASGSKPEPASGQTGSREAAPATAAQIQASSSRPLSANSELAFAARLVGTAPASSHGPEMHLAVPAELRAPAATQRSGAEKPEGNVPAGPAMPAIKVETAPGPEVAAAPAMPKSQGVPAEAAQDASRTPATTPAAVPAEGATKAAKPAGAEAGPVATQEPAVETGTLREPHSALDAEKASNESTRPAVRPASATARHEGSAEHDRLPASTPVPVLQGRAGESASGPAPAARPERAAPAGPVPETPESTLQQAPKPQTLREFSVVVPGRPSPSGAASQVELRVVERTGEVQVAVRSSDPALNESLRENLGQLTSQMSERGYRTETWHPGAATGSMETRETRGSGNTDDTSHDRGNSGRGGSDTAGRDGNARRDQQQKQPEWMDALERSLGGTVAPVRS